MESDAALSQPDPLVEVEAMKSVHGVLQPLTPDARRRVIGWVTEALSIDGVRTNAGKTPTNKDSFTRESGRSDPPDGAETFAELFGRAGPETNFEKVLVVGYWLQVREGADDFTAFEVNRMLNDLGERIANITMAFQPLIDSKPQLAVQLKKAGKTRQARKTYKVTVAGVQEVERRLRGEEPKN